MRIRFYLILILPVFYIYSLDAQEKYTEKGQASYYGEDFHGKKTASGETYDMKDFTAAHRTLPFGTKVKVTNLKNNKTVIVRINDRGPFKPGRIIDLSKAAAEKIDLIKYGVVDVIIETDPGKEEPPVIPDDKTAMNKGYYDANLKKVSPKGYGVQVGAYKEKSNALKNLNEISKKYNKPVYMYVTSNLNFKKYKIYIGEVKEKKQIESLIQELKKSGFPDCFSIKY
jgi:rare lipoprotein A